MKKNFSFYLLFNTFEKKNGTLDKDFFNLEITYVEVECATIIVHRPNNAYFLTI